MATAAVLPTPHVVHTTINYVKPVVGEAPYFYVNGAPEGKKRTNIETEPRDVVVHDVRGREDTVGLDKTGFQFLEHTSEEKEFRDEERIKTIYYKECEELLKRATGAKRVFIFDHTIRRDYEAIPSSDPSSQARGPVKTVHVDQTYDASVGRVHHHLGAEAERLLKSRVRIINVWRPIAHVVAHDPLGVADFFSLEDDDLMASRHIYPDREGGTFAVKYNPKHRWYFLADQRPDEVTLIKCFDSDTDKARLTPHTSFPDKSSPESAPRRQSIEVRALVFDAE
ncbi:hypothetical protein HGRIS_008527 [Hohenbuehelia grisea]|uniref:Methyltransferase n=1 Tax=Hohenbuehelia grisea TaxID=104357 RepID=A0ABR3J8H2_9AGAR